MVKQKAFLFFFFLSFLAENSFAMSGAKVVPARVVQDSSGKDYVSVSARRVSVLKAASPSIKPDVYCELLMQAVLSGTEHATNSHHSSERPASPLLGRCASPSSFLTEAGIPVRTNTPWELNFGASLLPAFQQIDEGNVELHEKWRSALEQFAKQLMKRRRIQYVRARGTVKSVRVFDPLLDRLEKQGKLGKVGYEIEFI